MEKLDPNDITSLVGLQCHLLTEKVERPGLDNPEGRVMVCSQLIKSPWEKKKPKATKARIAKPPKDTAQAESTTAGALPAEEGFVDLDLAGVLLMEALTEGTPVEIPDLIKRVFLAAKNAGQTAQFMSISKLIRDSAQLEPVVAPLGFKLEGTTVL